MPVDLLACLQDLQNEFILVISMDAKSRWVLQGGPTAVALIYIFWKPLQPRDDPSHKLYLQTEKWGKTDFSQLSSLLLALYVKSKLAQVWKADKILIMWFGAVITESMQKQSESLVQDRQSHWAPPKKKETAWETSLSL